MNNDQREIRRKLRILDHADRIGDVSKTCRYFGIGRASFYRWRHAYQDNGEAGLSDTHISSRVHRSSMGKWNVHTDPINRSSISFSATRTTSIWRPN